jgi:hypothetical protein
MDVAIRAALDRLRAAAQSASASASASTIGQIANLNSPI